MRGGTPRGATRTLGTARWPDGVIPYTIDPLLPSQFRVTDAIAQWESQTGITFVPRVAQTDYVTFRPSTGCSSSLGRVGGQQFDGDGLFFVGRLWEADFDLDAVVEELG